MVETIKPTAIIGKECLIPFYTSVILVLFDSCDFYTYNGAWRISSLYLYFINCNGILKPLGGISVYNAKCIILLLFENVKFVIYNPIYLQVWLL